MMKRLLTLLLLTPSLVLAQQGVLGSKPSLVQPPAGAAGPGIGVWEVAQLFLALALVAALLKWGLPWIIKRAVSQTGARGAIVVKETASLGACQLHLVETQGRTLLIGSSGQSVSLISDLSQASPSVSDQAPDSSQQAAPTTGPSDESLSDEDRVFFEFLDARMSEDAESISNRAVIEQPVKKPAKSANKSSKKPQPQPETAERVQEPRQESGEDMSMDEAVALIASAKRRAGIKPEPAASSAPRTEAPTRKPAPAKAPTDDEILAALERISKLTR
jgi:flagellar biogenesis protein FliO